MDWHERRHAAVRNYLWSHLGPDVADLRKLPSPSLPPSEPRIWTAWWQGEENAPGIVQECIASMRRSSGVPVTVITEKNYREFIDVPRTMADKVRGGAITLTALSDFIRFSLLARHGGMWLDATNFLSGPVPEDVWSLPFYSCRREIGEVKFVSKYRWTSFAMAAWAGHPLFEMLTVMTAKYWDGHSRLIDYLLIDYLIDLAVRHSPACKRDIEQIPFNNPRVEDLLWTLAQPFDQSAWENLTRETWLHKLSYKVPVDGGPGSYRAHLSTLVGQQPATLER